MGRGRSLMDFVIPVRQSNRHFTVDEKNAILDENEKCLELGSKAALARAIGIKAETIREWAIARESGELPVWADSNREDPRLNAGDKKQLKRVLRENEILKAKLARSEAAVDILGKASALLDAMAKSAAATEPQLEETEPGRPEWLMPKPGKTSP
jgi:transposase